MTTATYIEKDNNLTEGSTTYWFDMDGEMYGIVEGENAGVVNDESMSLDFNQTLSDRIADNCVVTDEMRAE